MLKKRNVLGPVIAFMFLICGFQSQNPEEQSKGTSPIPEVLKQDTLQSGDWMRMAARLEVLAKYDSALHYFQKAISGYSKVLEIVQDSFITIHYLHCQNELGNVYLQLGAYGQGIATLEKSLLEIRERFGPQHPLMGHNKIYQANINRNLGRLSEATQLTEEAYQVLKNHFGEDHLELVKVYQNFGLIHYNQYKYDQSIQYLRKAYDINKRYKSEIIRSADLINSLGNNLTDQGNYRLGCQNYSKALGIYNLNLPEEHPKIAAINYNIGRQFRIREDYDSTIWYTQKALVVDKMIYREDHPYVADDYDQLGIAYRLQNKIEKASENFQKGLRIRQKSLGEIHKKTASSYSNLGLLYLNTARLEKAAGYFQKALAINEQVFKLPNQEIAINLENIGAVFHVQGDFETAIRYYKKAIHILETNGEKDKVGTTFRNIGRAYVQMGNFEEGLRYLKKSEAHFRNIFGHKSPSLASTLYYTGEVYLNHHFYEEALEYFQKSLIAQIPNFSDTNYYKNPPQAIYSPWKQLTLPVISLKGKVFRELYFHKTKNIKDLIAAQQCFMLTSEFADLTRQSYKRAKSKQHHAAKILSHFELGITTAMDLYELTGQDSFLYQVFTFIEKNNATSLLESVLESDAKSFAGIPSALLDREKDLKSMLSLYKKLLFEEELKKEKGDQARIRLWQEEIFTLNQSFDSLVNYLEINHPRYKNLKYNLEVSNVSEVKNHLPNSHSALLEYFVRDTLLLVYVISKKETFCIRQTIDSSFALQISALKQVLHQFNGGFGKTDKQLMEEKQQYAQTAFQLYQILLEQPLQRLAEVDQLIIIPSGPLGYLPFELLLRASGDNKNYVQLPYLLRDYDIRYEYSATLLLRGIKNKQRRKVLEKEEFAGFAPAYKNRSSIASNQYNDSLRISRAFPGMHSNVTPLKFNQVEVADIAKITGGVGIIGQEATESYFKKIADNYRILHLAMHAFVNDLDPNYSHLVFDEESIGEEDRFLYAYELYNMQLHADLAVLSACETGAGKLQQGEGIISLSRAFKYAGCPNIVMSLWNANDQSTKTIMTNFYENLRAGMTKSRALRRAKLDFLDNAPDPYLAHPFYWGTFVLIGDDAPVAIGNFWGWKFWAGILILIVGGVYLFWRKSKN